MVPLLNRLENNDRDMLLINCKRMEAKRDEMIFEEGNPSKYMYFIFKGEVRLYKRIGKDDKEITIFLRREQDAFGEIGIFSGNKYSNSAQATQNCIIYYIEKGAMESIMSRNGRLGLDLSRWLADSLEASKAKMRDFISFGSEGAIASIFIRYSNMYGVQTSKGVYITEPIMLQDISKHVGISRETVSRIVSGWKNKGIIENEARIYVIKDIIYLKRLLGCEGCGVANCVL